MGKTYLVLHKSEWDRLHRKTDNAHQEWNERDEYYRKLVEKSQSWIKTWPDTVQGHVELVAKQKQKRHEEELAKVKKYLQKKKQEENKEALKRVRQMIFDDTCYGKKLMIALVESKNLEIRDIQIEFQKGLKEQHLKQEKEMLSKLRLDQCTFNLDAKQLETQKRNRDIEKEMAKINKSMYEMQISEKIKTKEEQINLDRENAKLMQELLDNEAQNEKEYEKLLMQDVGYYEKEHQHARARREERGKADEAAALAQRMELDRKYCKINQVMKLVNGDKNNTEQFKRNYAMIEGIKQQEQMRYNGFIEKRVKEFEENISKKEHEETAKQILERDRARALAESNKLIGEEANEMRCIEKNNKCVGDRQCILTKSCGKRNVGRMKDKKDARSLSFLTPYSKLQDQLIARRQQPSPWNGTTSAHAQFAERAGQTLSECRHKRFARKVVDEYRKLNCLDETTLPVPNY